MEVLPDDADCRVGFDLTDVFWFLEPANPRALYRTHDGYVGRFTTATRAAQDAGFILPADARHLIRQAATGTSPTDRPPNARLPVAERAPPPPAAGAADDVYAFLSGFTEGVQRGLDETRHRTEQ